MISMRKNSELFWILEMLLLTPMAIFWIGLVSFFMFGTKDILTGIIGGEYGFLRGVFVALLCPLAASWFAYDYIRENKGAKKDHVRDMAKMIIAISVATIVIVGCYLVKGYYIQ